ncbi:MAG: CHAD domain-containing protein [Burkholderiaceae bacterium]
MRLVSGDVLGPDDVLWARDEFRWLGLQTNRARDLDVHLGAVDRYRAALPPRYRAALEPFRRHLLEQAAEAHRTLAMVLGGARYRALCDGWRARLEHLESVGPQAQTPIKPLADDKIRRGYRKLVARGRRIDERSPAEQLHALRVRGKQLRYLLEFFASLYPAPDIGKLVARLKKVQDALGDFQDASVQSASIRGFADEMAAAGIQDEDVRVAMERIAASILSRQDEARDAFLREFSRFSDTRIAHRIARLTEPG